MEIIKFGQPSDKAPLLLIHGAYCGAWIWERYFIPALAEAGYHGAAISLRGHGKSPSLDLINDYGVKDYLDDIAQGAALFPSPPVIVGHSLGGYLAQLYALDNPVAGLVLMAAPSLAGLSGSSLHISIRNPSLVFQLARLMILGPSHTNPEVIGEALFKGQLTQDEMLPMLPALQKESNRVIFEASWPQLRVPTVYPPVFVLAGDSDDFVPETDFRYEAVFWRAEIKIITGAPHAIMLAPSWRTALSSMTDWMTRSLVKSA